MGTVEQRLASIATRCEWFGDEANDYVGGCQNYGPRRRIMWAGDRAYTDIRLCSSHLDQIKTWDSGLVKRVSDHG